MTVCAAVEVCGVLIIVWLCVCCGLIGREQTEKAFQKQDGVFLARKRVLGRKTRKVR